jgi:hypothetical protein
MPPTHASALTGSLARRGSLATGLRLTFPWPLAEGVPSLWLLEQASQQE